jgi:hypothetical protein
MNSIRSTGPIKSNSKAIHIAARREGISIWIEAIQIADGTSIYNRGVHQSAPDFQYSESKGDNSKLLRNFIRLRYHASKRTIEKY